MINLCNDIPTVINIVYNTNSECLLETLQNSNFNIYNGYPFLESKDFYKLDLPTFSYTPSKACNQIIATAQDRIMILAEDAKVLIKDEKVIKFLKRPTHSFTPSLFRKLMPKQYIKLCQQKASNSEIDVTLPIISK